MSYSESNGQVILTMSREDYEIEIEREGYAARCWNYDRSRGPCPFVES